MQVNQIQKENRKPNKSVQFERNTIEISISFTALVQLLISICLLIISRKPNIKMLK